MSIIEDAAQLVKYNSIQGNKMNDIDVVYTMWGNLHKTEGMEVGQVNILDSFVTIDMNQYIAAIHLIYSRIRTFISGWLPQAKRS